MKKTFARFIRGEEGQDLIEYALLAGFISLVAVLAIITTGTSLNTLYGAVSTAVGNAANAS
jgi:pilus assembly protein Flp/PilA